MKKYITEIFGTFALTLAVTMSVASDFPIATPLVAALTLGLFVYTVGSISGAHFNPAISIGLWSIGKMKLRDLIAYIASQAIGAGAAFFLARLVLAAPPTIHISSEPAVGFAEMIGSLVFGFGVAAVASGAVEKTLSGLVVGGSLLVGVTVASYGSNGILNPAVALGVNSFSLVYVFGPIIGSYIGMKFFVFLYGKGGEKE